MINSMGKAGRHMKLSFYVGTIIATVIISGAVVLAEQPADPVLSAGVGTVNVKRGTPVYENGVCRINCPDPQGDHARELHKELAGTRGSPDTKPITFKVTTDSSSVLMFAKPCTGGTTNDVSFTVNDGDGHPIVSINECTGKVTVTHPERMDEQALAFWRTLQKAWPEVCAPRLKAPKK